MVAAYPWLVGWCAAFVSQEARNRVAHTQRVRAPVKAKALRDLPSPGAGRASVTAPLCNWGGRAKGESSPRPQPGARHTTRAPLPCVQPAPSGKKAGAGRRLLSWLWTRGQAPASSSQKPQGAEPGVHTANHQTHPNQDMGFHPK